MPGLGLHNILAKIDTGARTSALHVTKAQKVILPDGRVGVDFATTITGPDGDIQEISRVKPLVDKRRITSSNGQTQERLVIKTMLHIGEWDHMVEFTLSKRTGMRHPILLGRKAFRNSFLVDAGRAFLLTTQPAGDAMRKPSGPKPSGAKPSGSGADKQIETGKP